MQSAGGVEERIINLLRIGLVEGSRYNKIESYFGRFITALIAEVGQDIIINVFLKAMHEREEQDRQFLENDLLYRKSVEHYKEVCSCLGGPIELKREARKTAWISLNATIRAILGQGDGKYVLFVDEAGEWLAHQWLYRLYGSNQGGDRKQMVVVEGETGVTAYLQTILKDINKAVEQFFQWQTRLGVEMVGGPATSIPSGLSTDDHSSLTGEASAIVAKFKKFQDVTLVQYSYSPKASGAKRDFMGTLFDDISRLYDIHCKELRKADSSSSFSGIDKREVLIPGSSSSPSIGQNSQIHTLKVESNPAVVPSLTGSPFDCHRMEGLEKAVAKAEELCLDKLIELFSQFNAMVSSRWSLQKLLLMNRDEALPFLSNDPLKLGVDEEAVQCFIKEFDGIVKELQELSLVNALPCTSDSSKEQGSSRTPYYDDALQGYLNGLKQLNNTMDEVIRLRLMISMMDESFKDCISSSPRYSSSRQSGPQTPRTRKKELASMLSSFSGLVRLMRERLIEAAGLPQDFCPMPGGVIETDDSVK